MSQTLWRMSMLAVMASIFTVPARADGDTAEDWSLTLKDALGNGKDISVFMAIEGEKVAGAFGHARRFNKMPHRIDAGAVRLQGNRLTGTLSITIPWDGWVPVDRKPLSIEVAVDVTADNDNAGCKGTYRLQQAGTETAGAVTGTRQPAGGTGVVRRLTLYCRDIVRDSESSTKAQGLGVSLTCRDGKSFAARLIPPGSMTDVAYTATVAKHHVRVEGRRVQGDVSALVRNRENTDEFVRYDLAFAGMVIGNNACGTVKVTRDGRVMSDQAFDGDVMEAWKNPGDAMYTMTLHRAMPRHHHMNVLFVTRAGRIVGGFAVTPHFNNAIHTVDFTGLTLDGPKLTGSMPVTINPDPWIPADHKPVACRYDIEARVSDGELVGKFGGAYGTESVVGEIEGATDAKPMIDRIGSMTLKVEDGLFGRAFVSMTYDGGKPTKSTISNNHDRNVKGVVDEAALDWSGDRIRGTIRLRTGRGDDGWASYTCEVDGVLVGTRGAGTVKTLSSDGKSKSSTFWVLLTPAGP